MAGLGAALPLASSRSLGAPWSPPLFPVCVFSKHLQHLDYAEMADTAARLGFDGVDLSVRPGGHVEPGRVEVDLPKAVGAVHAAGLTVPLMTTAVTDAGDPHTERLLRTASDLGITRYRLGYLDYDRDKSIEDTLAAHREKLKGLEALNVRYGLHGEYQNHAGTRVGGPVWDVWMLVREMDPKAIGCQYDIRHAVVEGGTAWPLGLELLAPYIGSFCAKDFVWEELDGRWRVKDVPLGEGMVPFDRFLTAVVALGSSGPVSVHFEYDMHPPGQPAESAESKRAIEQAMSRDLSALRKLMARAGVAR